MSLMLNQSCETPLLCIDPTIVTPPQDSSVLRGGTVRLFCQVAASPRFLIIRWTKNGANISKTGSRISHKSDKFHGVITQTLVISNASDSDSGQYRCIVKNRKGRISSKPAGLTVKSRLLILFYFILFLIIIFCGEGLGGVSWRRGMEAPKERWLVCILICVVYPVSYVCIIVPANLANAYDVGPMIIAS